MEYQAKKKSYEEVKLDAILAVLASMGIKVSDEFGIVTIAKDGKQFATIDISTPLNE